MFWVSRCNLDSELNISCWGLMCLMVCSMCSVVLLSFIFEGWNMVSLLLNFRFDFEFVSLMILMLFSD